MSEQHRNLSRSRRRFLALVGGAGVGAGSGTILSPRPGRPEAPGPGLSTDPTELKTLEMKEYSFESVTVDRSGRIVARRPGSARYWREPLGEGAGLEMVYIPGGTGPRGSRKEEKGDNSWSEKPAAPVTVAPFLLGKYPVTQKQWQVVAALPGIALDLPPSPSFFTGDDLPVERVSWFEAIEFCRRLARFTGKKYHLPSEARWEYACRAGTTTPFHCGETLTAERANYFAAYDPYADEAGSLYRARTTPVNSFAPNAFGLHDTHGNVCEWCADAWHRNYEGTPPLDGDPWLAPDRRLSPRLQPARLVRGGSWGDEARHCRSANRTFCLPEKRYSVLGFRVALAVT